MTTTVIDELIFDRTQADVDRVKELKRRILENGWDFLTTAEKSEYLAGMKGAYNATDLNRIGRAIEFIAENADALSTALEQYRNQKGVANDTLFDLPFDVSDIDVSPKTDWTVADIPAQQQIASLLSAIAAMRLLLPLSENVPAVPFTLDGMDYVVANNLEYILFAVAQSLDSVGEEIMHRIDCAAAAFIYCGEVNCGE